jgi:hypothetical protein
MRVLVLESHPGVGSDAVIELDRAGHEVVSCESEDDRAPCRGLAAGGDCPLDQFVDVAVLVQELGAGHLTAGARCAARDRVPVVEVDPGDVATRTPITGWTAVPAAELLAECTRAAHDGAAHVRAVTDRLVALDVVSLDDIAGGGVTFDVDRDGNRLRLSIRLGGDMTHRAGEIVRAATQALRDFDRHVAVIDVALRRATA